MTIPQKWRRKRNLTLALASLNGASCWFLGDVFDLSPSRVTNIIDELRQEMGELTPEAIILEIGRMKRPGESDRCESADRLG